MNALIVAAEISPRAQSFGDGVFAVPVFATGVCKAAVSCPFMRFRTELQRTCSSDLSYAQPLMR